MHLLHTCKLQQRNLDYTLVFKILFRGNLDEEKYFCAVTYFHDRVGYSMKQVTMVDHTKEILFSETHFTKTQSDLNTSDVWTWIMTCDLCEAQH